jgi:hypothetical protein
LCAAASLILMTPASTASAASIVTEWLDQALPYGQEVALGANGRFAVFLDP